VVFVRSSPSLSVLALLLVVGGAWGADVFLPSEPNVMELAEPVTATFVRVVVDSTSDGTQPCIDELEVYAPGGEENLAVAEGAEASASSCLTGYSAHAVEHLNDGLYGNARSWIPATESGQWAQIELAEATEIGSIVLSRDRTGGYPDRVPTGIRILTSTDGQTWSQVFEGHFRAPGSSGAPTLPSPPPAPSMAPSLDLTTPTENEDGYANLALRPEVEPAASSVFDEGRNARHQVDHLNDGASGNDRSWIAAGSPGWAEVDLGEDFWIYQVALGNDAAGKHSDRAMSRYRVLVATEHDADSAAPAWTEAFETTRPLLTRRVIGFEPVRARWVRIAFEDGGSPRIDELEVYGDGEPIPAAIAEAAATDDDAALGYEDLLKYAFVAEEHAWLKTYGYADLDPSLVPYNGRVTEYPRHVGDDVIPVPTLGGTPDLNAVIGADEWSGASMGTVRVAFPDDFEEGALVEHRLRAGIDGSDLHVAVEANRLLNGRVLLVSTQGWDSHVCLDLIDGSLMLRSFEVDGAIAEERPADAAIALAEDGSAVIEATIPRDLLPDADALGLRFGLGFGGRHTAPVGRPVHGKLADVVLAAEPSDNDSFAVTARTTGGEPLSAEVTVEPGPIGPQGTVSLEWRGEDYSLHLLRYDPTVRTLTLATDLAARLRVRGVDLDPQLERLEALEREHDDAEPGDRELFYRARMLKRDIFLRDPGLAQLTRILYVERYPYEPSHIYTDYTDAPFRPGGGVYILETPFADRLEVREARRVRLFDAGGGIARDPVPDFGLSEIFFGYRPAEDGFYHLMRMNADGSGLTQLTDGPFHDFYPCPLPDGDLAFISTRCTSRVFCFRGGSSVLFRMDPDGSDKRPLSYSSLSEWAPSVRDDGRIIWTRWEYLDKGADFSQTLWSINPDGTRPELVFGNTIIQPNGYANGREVPGTQEISCTLVSHFGDINGPIALVDLSKGRMNPDAIKSITPEVPWPGMWPRTECFRDPYPISRDLFLVSHAPKDRFGLYVIDRYGNREILHLDSTYGSMGPIPFESTEPPPVIPDMIADSTGDTGRFDLIDVYQGLGEDVSRGSVKYIRVVEEVEHNLDMAPNRDHEEFMKWYASPVDLVSGPYGWPAYVAKAPLGLVPVDEDGSASFTAPAGKILYFQALDEDLNEIQRMRSMVHLQPGETRTCIGCHEDRTEAPPVELADAATRAPVAPDPAPWGGQAFSYERVVQPVWDRNCVSCHDDSHPKGIDLRGDVDADRVPASYRSLITTGQVHYVDCGWNSGGCEKLEPLTFGSLKSPLWDLLEGGHHDVELTRDEMRRVKTWIDLNCPLWPDYQFRPERPVLAGAQASESP
jgi:hypothetical protein